MTLEASAAAAAAAAAAAVHLQHVRRAIIAAVDVVAIVTGILPRNILREGEWAERQRFADWWRQWTPPSCYSAPESTQHSLASLKLQCWQARSRILHREGGASCEGALFSQKSWRPFFVVVALKTWALPAARSIYLRYLRPTDFWQWQCYFTE